ncbi:MAG: lipopolysaccharide assembly protein LapA domain-containing protein [Pseudohongiellaceae bacterium]
MQKLSNLLSGLFLVLVFIASITFTYFNSTPVVIKFGTFEFIELPVSVWIIGAFASGSLLGLLLGFGVFRGIKSKAEIKRLTKQLASAEQEIQQLHSLSLQDFPEK